MKIFSRVYKLLILPLLFSQAALAMGAHAPLSTAEKVDLDRYVGKWFEIARLPQSFEKGCVGVSAEYVARNDGKISVTNTCRKETCEGKIRVANGIARVVDPIDNSKLKVSFFWPFEGDYWILKLGQDYEYAVVGSPDRKSLWILSRTSQMDESLINEIKTEFTAKGFNTEAFIKTTPCED